MNPAVAAVLGVLMRWVHITSVVILIGGLYYARGVGKTVGDWFRSRMYVAIAALLISGTYNLFAKASVPPGYHMWFGIKMLLVLHIFAVVWLLGKRGSDPAKHARWMTGVLISGGIVIAISAWLRWISLNPIVKLP